MIWFCKLPQMHFGMTWALSKLLCKKIFKNTYRYFVFEIPLILNACVTNSGCINSQTDSDSPLLPLCCFLFSTPPRVQNENPAVLFGGTTWWPVWGTPAILILPHKQPLPGASTRTLTNSVLPPTFWAEYYHLHLQWEDKEIKSLAQDHKLVTGQS